VRYVSTTKLQTLIDY